MKLALLGTGPTLRHAPFKDAAFTFWGVSQLAGQVPRLDLAFEIHQEPIIRELDMWAPLTTLTVPVVMLRVFPEVPRSVAFRYEDVKAHWTVAGREEPFLTSSFDYMLAHALLQPDLPRELHVFGFDMAQASEFQEQKGGGHFWLGACVARGIRVVVPAVSDLLKAPFLYGRDELKRRGELADLTARLEKMSRDREQAIRNEEEDRAQRFRLDGAIAATKKQMQRANW
jgi:hypothetical protein